MHSDATTVEGYLASLPEDRRAALSAVRDVILANLAEGFEEAINWGMITYQVPLSTYPKTYNGQPLMYAALASQKDHMAVYLTGIYMSDEARSDFENRYRATGKRMDAGKSCVRFRTLDDLPLDLIGDCIAADSVEQFCARFEGAQSSRRAEEMKVEQAGEAAGDRAPASAPAPVVAAPAAPKSKPKSKPKPKPEAAAPAQPAAEPQPEKAAKKKTTPKKKAAAKRKAAPKKKAAAKRKAAPKKKAAAKRKAAPKKKAAAKRKAAPKKKAAAKRKAAPKKKAAAKRKAAPKKKAAPKAKARKKR